MLDWNGYWDGGLNDEEHTSSSRGWWPSIERQHGALVEEERLLEADGKPADERCAVATPGGEPWKRSSLIARDSEMDVHVLITALRLKRVVISGP